MVRLVYQENKDPVVEWVKMARVELILVLLLENLL
jgi:hypothetical protein